MKTFPENSDIRSSYCIVSQNVLSDTFFDPVLSYLSDWDFRQVDFVIYRLIGQLVVLQKVYEHRLLSWWLMSGGIVPCVILPGRLSARMSSY